MAAVTDVRRDHPGGWSLQALVLAVIAGVLAMHALGPGGAFAAQPHAGHETVAHTAHAPQERADCAHTPDGPHRLDHADSTCAAAGVGASYAPPALARARIGVTAAAPPAAADPAPAEYGRPPPGLSELQLLRI